MSRLVTVFSFACACALVLTGVVVGAVAADSATPGASTEMAAKCEREPRVLEDVMALFGTPAPEGAGEATSLAENDAAMGEEVALPTGEPADEATTAAVEEAVSSLVACFNEGKLLAGWAYVTEDFLKTQVGSGIFDEDFLAQIEAGPTPLAEDQQTRIFGFGEATVLDDGRVGILWSYTGPSSPGEGINGQETDFFIFKSVDDHWLLDEVVPNLESQVGIMGVATPVAEGTPATA